MRSSNPVFRSSPQFNGQARGGAATFDTSTMTAQELQARYDAPTATAVQTGRLTLDDVVVKTGILFTVLLAAAVVSWQLVDTIPALPLLGMVAGLVLGLVISFRQSTNPALILSYAALEGLFVGGVSWFYQQYAAQGGGANVVGQAVIGTIAAFAAMLVLYRSGRLRATPKFTQVLLVAGLGYLLLAVASVVAAVVGVGGGFGFYGVGGLGLLLSVGGVALASLFLILDFDFIERAVASGAPARVSWLAAFGLVVTLVWLYLEILRLLSILQGRD